MTTFIRLNFALESDDKGEVKYNERFTNIDMVAFIEEVKGGSALVYMYQNNVTFSYVVKENIYEIKTLLAINKKYEN
jgi:hypothetical protein